MGEVTFTVWQPIPDGEHWTDEAIDGLVGQVVQLRGSQSGLDGPATIIEARREGRRVAMTLSPGRAS